MTDETKYEDINERLTVEGDTSGPLEILNYFKFNHLENPVLQDVSSIFAQAALDLIDSTPENREQTVALRKLLEAKDAAVRSAL